jgi:topoisomerase-4 subunit A
MVKEKKSKDNGRPAREDNIHDVLPVSGLYENWFLDYASYVILERAVPAIEDGLKPVQRRILHAMKEVDDGRFNKVANIIGNTMQYHPHGDASISEAIVGLGQKDILLDMQGNWGDIRTGDGAAAPRYIEARLSKFALEVVFNSDTTEWQLSYDGRKKEPVTLPVKFPLLLAQGVEGIAVGLSTRVLPHNFNELIDASIDILKGKKISIFPDFLTGGMADFSEYNEGQRGGRVRVRAIIEEVDKKTLIIRNIPFSTTTTSLIESIVKASEKGNIKIKKVVDNTAKDVEIEVHLAPGQSPNLTIDALYAFTDCEISISPNACVIVEDKPQFLSVNEILRISTRQTVELLRRELEIKKSELLERILFSSLEKIFIEKRIYRNIEECETWEAVIATIDKGLKPYKKQFYREITQEDIVRLTEIKIKRISRYDGFKADELLKRLQDELAAVEYNLKHLVDFAVKYFQGLKDKYGKGRDRLTEIRSFDTITASVVAANNQKLYVNRVDGFIGYGLKKDEYICECSDLDDIIAFRRDGKFIVSRIAEKVFMGKDILQVGVFDKNDERMVYNMVYLDGKSGKSMVKRFHVLGVTRDKEYDLTMGNPGSRSLYLTANQNGEAEIVTINLSSGCKAHKKVFDFDFSTIEIKGRSARGNILTKYPVRKIQLKSEGLSTLGGLDIWYDSSIGRFNRDGRGDLLGNFLPDDSLLLILDEGTYQILKFDINFRVDPEKTLLIEKFNQDHVISSVYFDGESNSYYVKRFTIETTTLNKKFGFISESKGSKLIVACTKPGQQIEVEYDVKRKDAKSGDTFKLDEMIDVKGWKASGNKIGQHKIKRIIYSGDDTLKKNLPDTSQKADIEIVISEKNEIFPVQEEGKVKPVSKKKQSLKTAISGKVKKEKLPAPPVSLKSKSIGKKKKKSKTEQTFEAGTTIDFKIKKSVSEKDQLKLFDK